MPYTNHTSKEVELRGEAIYRREIRDKVEPNHKGRVYTSTILIQEYLI